MCTHTNACTRSSILCRQIPETSNAVWLQSPGILSALLDELPCLCVKNLGNPYIRLLLSFFICPFVPLTTPQRVCCMKVRLSSPRHPARDYDTTASADNRTYCLEEPEWTNLGKRQYDKLQHGRIFSYTAMACCLWRKQQCTFWIFHIGF